MAVILFISLAVAFAYWMHKALAMKPVGLAFRFADLFQKRIGDACFMCSMASGTTALNPGNDSRKGVESIPFENAVKTIADNDLFEVLV
jgi:hypothetical protein